LEEAACEYLRARAPVLLEFVWLLALTVFGGVRRVTLESDYKGEKRKYKRRCDYSTVIALAGQASAALFASFASSGGISPIDSFSLSTFL